MSAYNQYKTDPKLEQEGVLVEYGDFSFTLARAGGSNKRFLKCVEKLSRPYRKMIQQDKMDREVMNKLMIKAYAETIFLGWDNMKDQDGEELPFTKENIIKVMTDLPDLWEDVLQVTSSLEVYRLEVREDEAKN